jgi:hypothetical protein
MMMEKGMDSVGFYDDFIGFCGILRGTGTV